jgi:DNA-damage-inducible protein J
MMLIYNVKKNEWRIKMAQTNISIRIDEDVKRDVEILCDKIGLTMSALTNIFYRQFIRSKGIPFPVTINEPAAQRTSREKLREALEEAQAKSVINGTDNITMDEIDELVAEVRAERRVSK